MKEVLKVLNTKGHKYWQVKASSPTTGELFIYGGIFTEKFFDDDVSPSSIKDELEELGDIERLNIYINSPGGNVFSGNAIYNILQRHPANKTVYIDGLAASAASVIAMAGNTVVMPGNSLMMIHRAWMITMGNGEDIRKDAEMLDRVDMALVAAYQAKTGLEPADILQKMTDETWLTAEEAKEQGFADEVAEAQEAAAFVDENLFARYRNVPENLKIFKGGGGLSEDERRRTIEDCKGTIEFVKINKEGIYNADTL